MTRCFVAYDGQIDMIERVKIKNGALIFHDHRVFRWPNSWSNVDVDMIFDAKWEGTYWDCVADGFGSNAEYGHGSIFVNGFDNVKILKNEEDEYENV